MNGSYPLEISCSQKNYVDWVIKSNTELSALNGYKIWVRGHKIEIDNLRWALSNHINI